MLFTFLSDCITLIQNIHYWVDTKFSDNREIERFIFRLYVYFSDMLRNSKDLESKIRKLDGLTYTKNITDIILRNWANGNYKFKPETNTEEIFSYFGKKTSNKMNMEIGILNNFYIFFYRLFGINNSNLQKT